VGLTADARTILERMKTDPSTASRRPNLTISGGLEEVELLLRVREPLYRECADYVVNTGGKRPEQVTDEIVCFLGTRLSSAFSDTRGANS
jgi:shikimate kinase